MFYAASVSSPDGGRGRLRGDHRLELAAAAARVVFLTAAHALEPKLPPRVPDSTEQREPTMTRGMPSMTALLGLLALAGYQNRDKLAELLKGAGGGQPNTGAGQQPLGGLLGNLSGMLGGAGAGGLLSGGIGELLDRFQQNGQGDKAEILDQSRSEQGCLSARIKAGDRLRRSGTARTADRTVAGGNPCQIVARASGSRRQIHAGRPFACSMK